LCTTSPVAGSIDIGPRGLSHAMPFIAAISASLPAAPLVLRSAS
jgi:hypothetical protein